MAKTYLKKPDVLIYETNPSIAPVAARVQFKTKKAFIKNGNKALVVNQDTNELMGKMGAVFYSQEKVDPDKFIKVYAAGIDELMNLTGAGYKIFKLIYFEMSDKKDLDYVYLDFTELVYFNRWKWSINTFNTGINELLKKGIIYKTISKNKYFINIELFFNGNRFGIIKDYILDVDQLDLLNDI